MSAYNLAIKLNAGHDRNGNPLRAWVILDGAHIVDVVDEEYLGDAAVFQSYPNAIIGPEFNVSAKEYRRYLKMVFKSCGRYCGGCDCACACTFSSSDGNCADQNK